jgi:hypothetical protein
VLKVSFIAKSKGQIKSTTTNSTTAERRTHLEKGFSQQQWHDSGTSMMKD